jgi:hypothetical protein
MARKLSKLPPFGPAVLKLLNISLDDESAPTLFEEAFKSDPALTAELLVMANSAAFGGRSRVQTILAVAAAHQQEFTQNLGAEMLNGRRISALRSSTSGHGSLRTRLLQGSSIGPPEAH